MKPRALREADDIPLDDPTDFMDSPDAGAPEGAPPMPPDDEGMEEPPPMDAPMPGEEPAAPEGPTPEDMVDEPLDEPEATEEPEAAHGTGAITGKYNSSPVGDIKMSKSKGTYNTYKLEMSMGQLEVIRNALEKNHADPVSDELLATLTYYMDKLPGPGEEEEEAEARNNPQKAAMAGAEEGEMPIPMPPGGAAGAPAAGKEAQLPLPPKPGAPTPAKEKLMANAPGGASGKGPKPGMPAPVGPKGKKPPVGLPDFSEGGAGGAPEALPPPPRE